jgi:copper(I)-binding protein
VSRSPRNRRTGVAISVAIGAMALAGCGAGQIAQTSSQVASVGGAQANVGAISIRDAAFEFEESANASIYTRGEDAPLQMSIINSAGTEDRLVSASSPVASSVRISGEDVLAAGQTLIVEGAPAAEPAPSSGSATPTPAATPTPTAAPTAAAAAPGEGAQIVLVGVNQEIRPGLTYPVTLTFEKAGAVTFQVPVANSTQPREESAPE